MSDPIKAALDAATQLKRCTLAPLAGERADTAAVVAAFLRALDSGVMPGQSGDLGQWIFRKQWENMAAAIERAGRA